MDELITWLRVHLDNDEEAAQEVISTEVEGFEWDYLWLRQGRHNGRVTRSMFEPGAPSPRRMLAEIDAKRRILGRYLVGNTDMGSAHDAPVWNEPESQRLGEDIIRLLALPYSDEPGYREEWRP